MQLKLQAPLSLYIKSVPASKKIAGMCDMICKVSCLSTKRRGHQSLPHCNQMIGSVCLVPYSIQYSSLLPTVLRFVLENNTSNEVLELICGGGAL